MHNISPDKNISISYRKKPFRSVNTFEIIIDPIRERAQDWIYSCLVMDWIWVEALAPI